MQSSMEGIQINAKCTHIRMRVVAVMLALIVAIALVPSPALAYANAHVAGAGSALTTQHQAAGKALTAQAKTKAVKRHDFSTDTKAIDKAATKVKKGTTKLNVKKGQGYLVFTAPSTKEYSFAFSNLKCSAGASAFVEVQKRDGRSPQYSHMIEVSTKGGKSNTLWLSLNGYKGPSDVKAVDKPLASRTATTTLQKDEKIYFYFYNGDKKTSLNLKVK